MTNKNLSQSEIEALLNNSFNKDEIKTALTTQEKDILGEIGNICMGTSATTLYNLIGKRVSITAPLVTITSIKELADSYPLPYIMVNVKYTEGFEGNNILVLNENDVKIITDLMMGGTGDNFDGEIDEIRLSAISEAMNQMMGSSATSMADMIKKKVNISTPEPIIATFKDDLLTELLSSEAQIIQISFDLVIEGHSKSQMMQLMPLEFGKSLVQCLLDINMNKNDEKMFNGFSAKNNEKTIPKPIPIEQPKPIMSSNESNAPKKDDKIVSVKPMRFTSFDEDEEVVKEVPTNESLNIVIDLPLQVTVELGKCKKTVKEILELNIGSVIVLNKLAGELVDIVVNGKLIAKGEVIIIDENYGVRITDIITSGNKTKQV